MPALLERGAELRDFFPAVGGAVFGAIAAMLLSHLLLEATLSPFFAGCVALLLLVVSFLSLQRAFTIDAVPPPDLLGEEGEETDDFAQLTSSSGSSSSTRGPRMVHYEAKLRARKTLYCLAVICCLGSVSSLLLAKCRGAFWLVRAPIYCMLGNALCLVLVLAVADGLNLYLESASSSSSSSSSCWSSRRRMSENLCHVLVAAGSSSMPAEYLEQLAILLCGCLTLGGAFGFFFVVFDRGDAVSRVEVLRYRYLCVPLSVLICSLLAVALNRTGPPQQGLPEPAYVPRHRSSSRQLQQQQQQQQQQLQQQRWRQDAFVDDEAEDETALFNP